MIKKVLILFCSLIAVSCAQNNSNNNSKIVKVGLPANPTTMDPFYRLDGQSIRVMSHIFDGLLTRDSNRNFIPQLAESWEQNSPTEWTFKLKQGVKFHNGNDFNADDVVFSVQRIKASPAMESYISFSIVTNAVAVDPYTVKLYLKAPFATLLSVLAMENVVMMDKETVSADEEKSRVQPVGTGPFEFVEWKNGDYVALKAFEGYRDGRPAIDELIFNVVPEATTRAIALETGELDVAFGLDVADYSTLKDNPKLEVLFKPSASILVLSGNFNRDFWKDKVVRDAVNLALDKEGIARIQYGEDNKPSLATSFIPDNVFGKTNIGIVNQDIARAKSLIAQNYPNGLKMTITVPGDYRSRIAEIIQANLAEIGIELTINVKEWAVYLDDLSKGNYDISIYGWYTPTLDSDLVLSPKMHGNNLGAAGNYSFYVNRDLDRLIDGARASSSDTERKNLYAQAQQIIFDDVPVIPLYYSPEFVGLNKRINNFFFHPAFNHSLRNVSIK